MGLFFTTLLGWGAAVIKFFGGGDPDEPDINLSTSSDYHMCAADFDGSSEYYLNSTAQSIGIANSWSIAVWVNVDTTSGAEEIVEINDEASNNNRILFRKSSTASNWEILIADSSGTTIKNYRWSGLMTSGIWYHIVFTWNGTDLTFYWNGVVKAATTSVTDGSGTMTDTSRKVAVGVNTAAASNHLDGKIHSIAIWDTVLDNDAIKTIFNRGAMGMTLLDYNFGNYDTKADLQHWWRLGYDTSDLGADYGFASTLIDIDTNSSGITFIDHLPIVPAGFVLGLEANSVGGFPSEYLFDNTGLTLGVGNSYTMACWVAFVGAPTTTTQIIQDINDQTTDLRNGIRLYSDGANSGKLAFQVGDDNGTPNTQSIVSTNGPPSTFEWVHIVGVKDGTTSIKVYVNGVLEGTETTSVPTTTDAGSRAVGVANRAVDMSAAQSFDGYWAEGALWSSALTANEIQTLYNSGNPFNMDLTADFRDYVSSANLVEWWTGADPAQTGETGSDYVRTRTGSVDLSANASGLTHAGDLVDTGPYTTQINFDGGGSEVMEDTTEASVGIANAWTINFWASPTAAGSTFETVFDLRPDTSSNNLVQIGLDKARVNDSLGCAIADGSGTTIKNYRWDAAASGAGEWHMYTVTWNGTSLRGYRNATEDASPVALTDGSGSQSDGSRKVTIGDSELKTTGFNGRVTAVAVWDEVISDAELEQIWVSGMGVSLTKNFNAYTSSANLVHYWPLGYDADDFGDDLGSSARDLTETGITNQDDRQGIAFEWNNSYD